MEQFTVKREKDKTPKEMLLNLFFGEKKPIIVLVSDDWLSTFLKCNGVYKDNYSLDSSDSYFVNGNDHSLAIDVILASKGSYLIRCKNKIWNHEPAKVIYYFE